MTKKKITEAYVPKPGQKLLVDSLPISLQLVEDGMSGGKLMVRGEFARSDIATENKRVYPRSLWEREIRRLNNSMQERKLFGELDHPNDGTTKLTRASHIITAMEVGQDGTVMGEAEVLDTARGKDLKAMLSAGCKVGVSSRGYGSTRTNDKGSEVVQEDYNLVTFDFVAEPADSTAYPEVYSENAPTPAPEQRVSENRENDMGTQAQREADQEKAKAFAAAVQAEAEGSSPEDLAKQFEADILNNLGKLSAEARERIRAEMLADPAVGRAKEAVEAIKTVLRPFVLPEDVETVVKQKDEEIARLHSALKERDLKIHDYEQQTEQLATLARQAGFKYFTERALSGNPDKKTIIESLGDMTQFENAEALKAAVGEIVESFKQRRAAEKKARALAEQKENERRKAQAAADARAKAAEEAVRRERDQLQEALEKSLESHKQLAVQLFAERRLATHPNRGELNVLMERVQPKTKEEVEAIIEEHDRLNEERRDPDQLEAVRSRVREATKGGSGSTPLNEERPSPRSRGVTDYNGLGIDLGTLKQLSGIGRNGAPALPRGAKN
jgi:hypothetical protein